MKVVRAVSTPHGDERNPCLKLRKGPLSERVARKEESGVGSPCRLGNQWHACKNMSGANPIDRYHRIRPTGVKGTPTREKEDMRSIQRGKVQMKRIIWSKEASVLAAGRSSVEVG